MDYIAKTSVGKKHVFCLNINYDLCKWNHTFFKKKKTGWHRRTDKGGHTEERIVKGDFVSQLISRLYISRLRASNLLIELNAELKR